MDYQVIDSDNYMASGIETFAFPGGELGVKFHKPLQEKGLFFAKLRTWNDVGYAAHVINALSAYSPDNWRAFIPYYPGARQDRRTSDLCPLTVELMFSLLHHHSVMTWTLDPHSEVLIKMEPKHFMPHDILASTAAGIIAPDKGAYGRAHKFHLRTNWCIEHFIQCDKKRDPKTGALSGYVMPDLPEPGQYVIIDDICDGGGTFNLLAEEFKKKGYGPNYQLELYVSHGIFSKGLDNIDPIIEHIYTTDSFCQLQSNSRLTVIPLNCLFDKIMNWGA